MEFTLQDTGVFIGVIGSLVMLSGVAISIISKINKISFTVDGIQDALKLHATNAEKIKDLDKRLDIHLQDYVNYKDANLLSHNGLGNLIEHKWERSEEEFDAIKGSIKELQGFLHRNNDFKIRE
ncbi:hypothetical protein CDG76_30735 [Nostoc sp. 'Peltigera membranacea cyanobiont' 210A]|uniref:hypothetical protein n=1 Tax=Nostoc sp. 'Peltigera membranacea cyanobiont' 210A TaxID=2014529 RepID=UPI000B95B57F|nr:hypothetical protein [Nostoc sp. 'Peltigera membranacea cyanobiont' 210A]OYD90603.1 hypothetical protein CDG76_30735 [Nostoc sp. 'Peltigera membranacea cyanobiont' 210A]